MCWENQAVYTEERNGYTIEIYPDDTPMNPREDFDHAAVMVCFHNRYTLGDETGLRSENFEGWKELEKYLVEEEGAKVFLPVYMYEHSNICLSTGEFYDPWDSGRVGVIYLTSQTILKEWNWKRLTKARREKLVEYLKGEVEEYSDYLSGNVYGYMVRNSEGEDMDSCWGFFGNYDSYVLQQAREAADSLPALPEQEENEEEDD